MINFQYCSGVAIVNVAIVQVYFLRYFDPFMFLCHCFHHSFSLSSNTLLVTQLKDVSLLNIALCHGLCYVVFVMNCLHFLRSSTHTLLFDCVTSSDALCWLFVMNDIHFPSL